MNYLELAQECQLIGMRPHLDGIYQEALEKFASLVEAAARADERDKYEAKFKKLIKLYELRESQPNKPCCLAEREACAKVCEPQEEHDDPLTAWKIAKAIRARGTT